MVGQTLAMFRHSPSPRSRWPPPCRSDHPTPGAALHSGRLATWLLPITACWGTLQKQASPRAAHPPLRPWHDQPPAEIREIGYANKWALLPRSAAKTRGRCRQPWLAMGLSWPSSALLEGSARISIRSSITDQPWEASPEAVPLPKSGRARGGRRES